MILKVTVILSALAYFDRWGVFCVTVKLHLVVSAINSATPSCFNMATPKNKAKEMVFCQESVNKGIFWGQRNCIVYTHFHLSLIFCQQNWNPTMFPVISIPVNFVITQLKLNMV